MIMFNHSIGLHGIGSPSPNHGEDGVLSICPFFANALAAKGLWRILKIKNLWTNIIIHKYISPYSIKDWFRMRHKSYRNILTMWRAALNAFDLVADGFIWQIGDGKSMRLGIDPWIGCNEEFRLQDHIVEVIQNRGFCFWPAFRI